MKWVEKCYLNEELEVERYRLHIQIVNADLITAVGWFTDRTCKNHKNWHT